MIPVFHLSSKAPDSHGLILEVREMIMDPTRLMFCNLFYCLITPLRLFNDTEHRVDM